MKRLGLLVVVAACACFGETLFDIDFGSASNRVDSDLERDGVLALAAKGPVKDLYGNPVTAETLIPGTIVYAD